MEDKTPKPPRGGVKRITSNLRGPGELGIIVKDRVGVDALWSHFARNGAWICPFCLSAVRSHEDTRAGLLRAVESHLDRRCTVYRGGAGQPQTAATIVAKRSFEDIAHLAATDPAWQVFDHEGYWYSPTSLQRVPTVRIANGRFDSFTIQNMVNHLSTCPQFQQGTMHPVEVVQRARDQSLRAVSLTANIRQLVQFPLWRYTTGPGTWVCPFCLGHIQGIRLASAEDWQHAPVLMAQHLAFACPAYVPEHPEPQSEQLVQQSAQSRQSPISVSPAGGQATTHTPESLAALRRPPGKMPSGQHTVAPVAKPATSTGTPVLNSNSKYPTPRAPMPPTSRTPLGTDGAPPVARPAGSAASTAVSTPPRGAASPSSGAVKIPPVAKPIGEASPRQSPRVNAPVATPTKPPPVVPLFDNLEGDFLSHTPLGLLANDGHTPPPAAAAPAAGAAEDEAIPDLDWMDTVEGDSNAEIPAADPHSRTDVIRARDVQQKMMQNSPDIPGFKFATRFEACADISGDFYEFIKLKDGRIGFAQGDVSGHGMHAGLVMSMAKKTLSIYAAAGTSPSDTLTNVNDSLVGDLGGKIFVSMLYAILDPSEHTITWARAGHNPVIHYNLKSGAMAEIKPKGMVVGMKSGPLFGKSLQQEVSQLRSGDVYLIYTDGITETMNRQQVEYGVELLQEVVRKHAASGPEALVNRIMDSVRQFRGGGPPSDDSTLLVLAVD